MIRWLLIFFLVISNTCYAKNKTIIAVLDTGLDLSDPRFKKALCKEGHRDFSGDGIKDYDGHGTHVAGLIMKNMGTKHSCMVIVSYVGKLQDNHQMYLNLLKALSYASSIADVVNFSGGGIQQSSDEYNIIRSHPEVIYIVAAGNEHSNIDNPRTRYYPASYPLSNIIAVGALNGTYPNEQSNWGSRVTWEQGTNLISTLPNGKVGMLTGTSMATALFTGKWVNKYVK